MPTYDYLCEACGAFEHWQSIKDNALTECPKCGAPVKKLISKNVNIIFKGPGFYSTDNRSSSYADGAKSDKGDAAPSPAAVTSTSSSTSSAPSASSGKGSGSQPAAPTSTPAPAPATPGSTKTV